LIQAGNTDSSSDYFKKSKENNVKPHPARFPKELPEFFIRLTTEPEDVVLDPFAGSNMTGCVAQGLSRRWIGFEIDQGYVKASSLRFPDTAIYASAK
jgi:site-specific DNA-methyltransferase (cytosine-N4-specific)